MTEAQAVDAARDDQLPAPVAWERALPSDPDLEDLPRRLMRAISTRIQHREAIAAARAAQPPADVSATAADQGAGDRERG